jgi:hypothetical protein
VSVPLEETSPTLIKALTKLGNEYGPRGVIETAMQMWPGALEAWLAEHDRAKDAEIERLTAALDHASDYCERPNGVCMIKDGM